MENHHTPPPTPGAPKTILVLSDSELLLQVITANLDRPVQGVCFAPGEQIPPIPDNGTLGLIVVALSAPSGEPVVALTRANVLKHVGQVPMLIVSDRRFDPLPEQHIYYLRFPFDAAALRRQVRALLAEGEGTMEHS